MLFSSPFKKMKKIFRLKEDKAEIDTSYNEEVATKFFDIYEKLDKQLEQMAIREIHERNIIKRDLIPHDLIGGRFNDTTTWDFNVKKGWNMNRINTYENKIGDCKFIGIMIIKLRKNHPLTQIRIITDGSIKRYWHIENIDGTVFTDMPIIIPEAVSFSIDVYSKRKANVNIQFDGIVYEKEGLTVGSD